MAARGDIEAGKAHVTLWLKKDQLMAGLKSVQQIVGQTGAQLMRVGAALTGVGTSILAAGVAAATAFATAGTALYKLSNRTGLAVASLAELHYAAQQSGVALEAVDSALGVMVEKRLNPERFDEIAASIAHIEDRALQAATATQYWGSTGAQLIPMLTKLKELRQQARDLGIAPSPEQVALAAQLAAVWARLRSVIDVVIFQIGAALAPVIVEVLDSVIEIATAAAKWIRANGEMVRMIAGIGVALAVVGTIVLGIGAGLVAIAALCGAITALITLTLNPVGAVVVAVVAVGTALTVAAAGWLIFTESGRNAARWVWQAFKPVFEFITKSMKGITDALIGGDFKLAGEIAAKSLEVAFLTAIDRILDGLHAITKEITWQLKNSGNPALALIANAKEALDAARGIGGPSNLAGQAKDDLQMLLNTAAEARNKVTGKSDSLSSGGFEAMKSLGSFNPYAVTLQNYGKGDGPEKKQQAQLKTINDSIVAGTKTLKDTIENSMTYGT